MQLQGTRHQEPGQQLRLWPTALPAHLAVLPNPRCLATSEVPLEERVLPPLQACSCSRPFYATTRAHSSYSLTEALRASDEAMIEDVSREPYKEDVRLTDAYL